MMVSRPVLEQMPQVMAVHGLEDRPCTKHGDQGEQKHAETGIEFYNVSSCMGIISHTCNQCMSMSGYHHF